MLMFYVFYFKNNTESLIVGTKLESRIYVTKNILNILIDRLPDQSSYHYEKIDDIIIDALSHGVTDLEVLKNIVIIDYAKIKAHII